MRTPFDPVLPQRGAHAADDRRRAGRGGRAPRRLEGLGAGLPPQGLLSELSAGEAARAPQKGRCLDVGALAAAALRGLATSAARRERPTSRLRVAQSSFRKFGGTRVAGLSKSASRSANCGVGTDPKFGGRLRHHGEPTAFRPSAAGFGRWRFIGPTSSSFGPISTKCKHLVEIGPKLPELAEAHQFGPTSSESDESPGWFWPVADLGQLCTEFGHFRPIRPSINRTRPILCRIRDRYRLNLGRCRSLFARADQWWAKFDLNWPCELIVYRVRCCPILDLVRPTCAHMCPRLGHGMSTRRV